MWDTENPNTSLLYYHSPKARVQAKALTLRGILVFLNHNIQAKENSSQERIYVGAQRCGFNLLKAIFFVPFTLCAAIFIFFYFNKSPSINIIIFLIFSFK